MADVLLEVKGATKTYGGGVLQGNEVVALDGLNLTIEDEPATITTIAGESGSGKTSLVNAVLGLISLTRGQIKYRGRDVSTMSKKEHTDYRREVQAIFQDPYEVYNPFYRIGRVFDQVIKRFGLADTRAEGRRMIEDALNTVGLVGDEVLGKHPHQLSGGQRQRIMIARACLLRPRLIVADEPVSMVDASLRANILSMIGRMRDEIGISFLYVTHDLSTANLIGDEIYVLYAGTIAEHGATNRVISNPRHPYVKLLVDSVPVPDPKRRWSTDVSLPDENEGIPVHDGCLYYPRCPDRMDRCITARPRLYAADGEDHSAACFLYETDSAAGAPAEG